MSPIGDSNLPVIGAARTAAARARALKSVSSINSLHAESQWRETSDSGAGKDRRPSEIHCSVAAQSVPFRYVRHSSYPSAGFAAQLLGQLMGDDRAMPSRSLAAYDEQPLAARFCDRHL